MRKVHVIEGTPFVAFPPVFGLEYAAARQRPGAHREISASTRVHTPLAKCIRVQLMQAFRAAHDARLRKRKRRRQHQ